MDDIKEGSIDLADQTIDLSEIEDAYDEDLDDVEQSDQDNENESAEMMQQPVEGAPM